MKRFVAFALTALMLSLSCVVVFAEEPTDTSHLGAEYTNKEVYGAVADNTANVHFIEFDPADGLIPMAYSGNGGYVCLAEDHVDAAVAEGYEVAGAINGSFFEMSTGSPCGTLISDGKLIFTHSGLKNESIAVFDMDGKCQVVTSTLRFSFQLGGKSVPAGIGLINKTFDACGLVSGDITSKFHYYDIDAGDIADETVLGYEVICEKKAGTILAVGETLKGNVVEVKADSYYGKTDVLEDNQFIIFVRSDSSSVNKAAELEAGDTVSLSVKETNANSMEAMENAHSCISSAYWLVKDGKDLTDTQNTIIHSTSLARAWTVFGIKDDGSYVFWASSEVDADGENAISLKDIADEMVKLGCTSVIRLDGGGSTSMYVKGEDFVMSSPRKVCDVLLIVTKDSLKYEPPFEEPETSDESSATEVSPDCAEPAESSVEDASEPIGEVSDADNGSESGLSGIYIYIIIGCVVIPVAVIVFIISYSKRKKK